MVAKLNWVIPLSSVRKTDEPRVGGKAARLAQLSDAGFAVPMGFCVPVEAYEYFVKHNNLNRIIRMELGRKAFSDMRWEEMWDAALRIRSAFLTSPIPPDLSAEVRAAAAGWAASVRFAVRSSAPGEDSREFSFAGLHESYVDVQGQKAILQAVKRVWSSLWSDAALLYKREIGLDSATSRMAVVVQPMQHGDVSGVAFGQDPRHVGKPRAVVEAVPGLCRDLVDGRVDPDRWILKRPSGRLLEWRPGRRGQTTGPILSLHELKRLYRTLTHVERVFGWEPDMEWTQSQGRLTLLQARPITQKKTKPDDKRDWYMTLRPCDNRLSALRQKITDTLIPELEKTGELMAQEDLAAQDENRLASTILQRKAALAHWKKVYWDDFIPFAHGVRRLGLFYNDVVQPEDPYEFVNLLATESTRASLRNRALLELAKMVNRDRRVHRALDRCTRLKNLEPQLVWTRFEKSLAQKPGTRLLLTKLNELLNNDLDLTYGSERLNNRPDLLLVMLKEIAANHKIKFVRRTAVHRRSQTFLETKYFRAAGARRRKEAREILDTGRLSWRLRDDDNVLVGRIESQFLGALAEGVSRLKKQDRWRGDSRPQESDVDQIVKGLRDQTGKGIFGTPPKLKRAPPKKRNTHENPRQLVGQPVSPGVAFGQVRCVSGPNDMLHFKSGEVLVCDAIQPSMTHLVPMAGAIVERRGGMLMHGAIIARELNRPCVNGIPHAAEVLENGQWVTVDGDSGIVTIGPPEFDVEVGPHQNKRGTKKALFG